MKKILPISFYKPIESECWTRFRTSIISAFPELSGWFVNHLNNLYINNFFEVNYGEYEGKYQTLNHYESVLNSYNRSFHGLTKENIIEYLIQQINDDKYIIIECDTSEIHDYIKNTFFSETIIYGYDTESEIFYSEINFSFQQLLEAFQSRKELDCSDREKNFIYRQCWYPITLLEVRKDYKSEPNLQLFFNELVRHKRRRYFDITHSTENFNSKFREGICSVYEGFLEMLIKIKEGSFDVTKTFHSFPYNYNKLKEFNAIFKWRLEVLDNHYKLLLDTKIYDEMNLIICKLDISKNLASKYLKNMDIQNITKIYNYTSEVLKIQEKLLDKLMEIIMKNILYGSHYSVEKLIGV